MAATRALDSTPHDFDALAPPAPASEPVPPPVPSGAPIAALGDARGAARRAALVADGARHALDPAYVPYERLGGWIGSAVVLALGPLGIGGFALWSEPRLGRLAVLAGVWFAILALTVWSTLYFPARKFRFAAWSLSPAGLRIHSGVWIRTVTHVPRTRVQHIDVRQGPIERRYGLATLVVHTAGTTDSEVELEGIRFETAHAIKDELLAGLSIAAGAGDGA